MTENTTTTMRLGDIVLDSKLRVRRTDWHYETRIAKSMKDGTQFPPILVDRKTLRLIDGWTRYFAARRVFGPDHMIPVELGDYDSDDDMTMDAVIRNMRRGT